MKRLVLRIAALGTVVVLGLIAIAQAQRGSDDATPAADGSSPGGHQPSAEASPLAPPAGSENQFREAIPGSTGENPLRLEEGRLVPIDRSPAPNVLIADHHEGAPGVDATSAELPDRGPSADRFEYAGDSGRTSERSSAYPRDGVASVLGPGGMARPAGGPLLVPPPQTPLPRFGSPGTRDPETGDLQPYEPPPRAESPLRTPLASRTAETPATERYPELAAGASEVEEPGRFVADPDTAPTGLSAAEVGGPGRFTRPAEAAPGIEAPLTEEPPSGEGAGQPGSKHLEGPQSAQLTIQKSAPAAIQVGEVASFRVTVRNTGPVAAHKVEVRDQVPKGARLISTAPRASRGAGGELVWSLGALQPGDESTVEIQLEPITEGEIGSVANVRFQADASARTVVTKPELVLETSAPEQVLSGEQVTLSIEISNPGSGIAAGVVLEEPVPAGLQHPGGPALEYEVGDLPPGESRKLELTLTAGRAGSVTNVLTARAQGNLRTEDRLELEVIAPQLEVAVAGPRRRYLEREATYELSVVNPGSAPAKEVELVAYLSEGLKFVSANNSGHYQQATRTVHWRLEELPTDAIGTVELVALPIEAGQQKIRLQGTADRGVSADGEQAVVVEGIAAIKFEVVDVTDPIEVGGETIYEVRVVNQGSKAASNVRLAVLFPRQMRAMAGEGPTRHRLDREGSQVVFEGLPRLAPKADVTYRIRAQGLAPGDLRICAQLLSDEMLTPVTKQESTRVYSDE